jgi:hypothetical protein
MKVTPTRVVAVLLLTWFAVLSMACGSVRQAAERATRSNDLKQIALSYMNYCDTNKPKGPANVDDLLKIDPQLAPVAQKVKSGDYTVIWNVNLSDPKTFEPNGLSNTVLAYETAAPSAGGQVVMCDGFVKTMTAAEFNAAPKAKSGK